jgi:hypothetical protein
MVDKQIEAKRKQNVLSSFAPSGWGQLRIAFSHHGYKLFIVDPSILQKEL